MTGLSCERRGERLGLRLLALTAAFFVVSVAARPADAAQYKDDKKGFQLNTPGKWKQLPLAPDEKFVVASFASDREFEWRDDKTSVYDRHRPQLDVVILPKSETEKKSGIKAEKGEDGSIAISMTGREYKDFKDYLEQTSKQYGGFFISDEHETKVGDTKVMVYEVTIDKLANAPRKRWGWAFYTDEAIYGITGDALVKFEDKVRPDVEAAFRSFKIIPHSQAIGTTTTGGEPDIVIGSKKKLTPEERAKQREDAFNAYLARAKETMTDGWKIKESKNYIAITHCDDKFTKETLDHAEALRAWMDETLACLGSAVPGRAIIRCCADKDEYMAMWKTGGWKGLRYEFYTYKDRESAGVERLYELNGGLFRMWLSAKNEALGGRLPLWINVGLRNAITNAVSKGKKIELKNSAWENERLATARRAGKLISARDFLTKSTEELVKLEEVSLQAQCFAIYLVQGGAQKNPKYKSRLTDYLTNFVGMAQDEANKEHEAKPDAAEPTSEEEENAQFAARANKWKEEERHVLDTLLEKTFAGWTDKDWDSFNNSYAKELGE